MSWFDAAGDATLTGHSEESSATRNDVIKLKEQLIGIKKDLEYDLRVVNGNMSFAPLASSLASQTLHYPNTSHQK